GSGGARPGNAGDRRIARELEIDQINAVARRQSGHRPGEALCGIELEYAGRAGREGRILTRGCELECRTGPADRGGAVARKGSRNIERTAVGDQAAVIGERSTGDG